MKKLVKSKYWLIDGYFPLKITYYATTKEINRK